MGAVLVCSVAFCLSAVAAGAVVALFDVFLSPSFLDSGSSLCSVFFLGVIFPALLSLPITVKNPILVVLAISAVCFLCS